MNTCMRCEHEWTPRLGTEHSRNCPKCNSPYWDTPRREKQVFDVPLHMPGRMKLLDYIQTVHNGNMTAAAYHLGFEYPYIASLIKKVKIIPEAILQKIDSVSKKSAPKRLTDETIEVEFNLNDPVIHPKPHMRWTLTSDFITPISADQHEKECLAFRALYHEESSDGVKAFAKINGVTVLQVKDMYSGEEKIYSPIRKRLKI